MSSNFTSSDDSYLMSIVNRTILSCVHQDVSWLKNESFPKMCTIIGCFLARCCLAYYALIQIDICFHFLFWYQVQCSYNLKLISQRLSLISRHQYPENRLLQFVVHSDVVEGAIRHCLLNSMVGIPIRKQSFPDSNDIAQQKQKN